MEHVHGARDAECDIFPTFWMLAIAARQLGSNYLVNITMTGPHAVSRMLPTAYGTV
jgi:hypothetical protein